MNIIVDIDNTLCINEKRFFLAKKENKKIDWNIAYKDELIIEDEPHYPMIDLINRYKKDNINIIIITGRPEFTREVTEKWLKKYHVNYDNLYMREIGDIDLKADVLKKKIYEKYINTKIFCAFDDEESIISMWITLGIPCFRVYKAL